MKNNCFGYGYFMAGLINPERFVSPKTANELERHFTFVDSFNISCAIVYINLASSLYQPHGKRYMATHMVWIENDRATISHRPDTGYDIEYFPYSQIKIIFPEYYLSEDFLVQFLALK